MQQLGIHKRKKNVKWTLCNCDSIVLTELGPLVIELTWVSFCTFWKSAVENKVMAALEEEEELLALAMNNA
jgi:hypothetical protein